MFSNFATDQHTRICDGDGGGDGLRGDQILDVAVDPSGDVWIVTDEGLSHMTPPAAPSVSENQTSFDRVQLEGVNNNDQARALAVAPSGDVYVATTRGIVFIDQPAGDQTLFDDGDGLPSNQVRDVAVDVVTANGAPREVCWGATSNGLARLDVAAGGSIVAITQADGLASNDCRSIAVLADHTKVVGTAAGVASYSGL